MALEYIAQIGLIDSRGKITNRDFLVSTADAELWLDAATDVARQATDVGLVLAGIEAHSNAVTLYRRVIKSDSFPDAVRPDPESNIYHHDQYRVTFRADGRAQGFTIPARDNDAVDKAADGVQVLFDANGTQATQDLVAAIEGTVLGIDGGAATVEKFTVAR
jgi:hypothetical protein